MTIPTFDTTMVSKQALIEGLKAGLVFDPAFGDNLALAVDARTAVLMVIDFIRDFQVGQ